MLKPITSWRLFVVLLLFLTGEHTNANQTRESISVTLVNSTTVPVSTATPTPSHGCVNLRVDEAKWLFYWAEVGTKVRVIP